MSTKSSRIGDTSRWREVYEEKVVGKPCRTCPNRRVEAHHIVHRGRIGSKHPLIHHRDNVIPLCHRCHQNHHTTAHRRVPWDVLSESEQAFLVTHGGIGWSTKWYGTPESYSVTV